MIVHHDPDRYVGVSGGHRRHPGETYAGCTCSHFYGHREATPGEYRANRLARLRGEARRLSDELAEVNRQLNILGANDGT